MLDAVLFDLDGTLLDLDLDEFLGSYFKGLTAAIGGLHIGPSFIRDLMASTTAMTLSHPGQTNEHVFWEDFVARTGIARERWAPFIDRFYLEEFDRLGEKLGPRPNAREAVDRALSLGLKVAIATNPIFPLQAIRWRMKWAGLDDLDLPVVTAYENMTACKPAPEYYREVCAMLGAAPEASVMVGDDAELDMPASATGMRTFYVGVADGVEADGRGDLAEFGRWLEREARSAS